MGLFATPGQAAPRSGEDVKEKKRETRECAAKKHFAPPSRKEIAGARIKYAFLEFPRDDRSLRK